MKEFDESLLKKLYRPPKDSHKGQNGKLLIIGGSKLFHAASLWSLTVASRIVDMVYYSSIPDNNQIVLEAKKEFRNGIVIRRNQIDEYIEEADCVLIGPGLMRTENYESRIMNQELSLEEINKLENEGEQTFWLTKYILEKYPDKRFVFDAGALQMMESEWLLGLKEMPILTPHQKEFEKLFNFQSNQNDQFSKIQNTVSEMAKKYNCVVLLKGVEDIVCSPTECIKVSGGNAGMTKGGTGDVLAGLAAALYCKNDAFLSATCACYINKRAGDELFKRVGYYFNASDLVDEIPKVMTLKERRHSGK